MLKQLLLAATAIVASPAAAAPLIVLPTGHPVAEVTLDGSAPLRFVIDTAATSTSILPKLRAAMPQSMKPAGGQRLNAASGETQIETLHLGRLMVDGRDFQGLRAFSLPPGPVDTLGVDGVLGADVIADFAVEMDLPAKSWRMHEAVTPDMIRDMAPPVPFTLDEGRTPRLTVSVDGRSIAAILDTGARATIMNWAAARLLGLSPESAELVKAGTIQGVTSHGTRSVMKTFATLAVGQATRTAPKIRIADLSVFKVLGVGEDEPFMIVGIDMLSDRRFVIDHPGRRLYVQADAEAKAASIAEARPAG